ncbi:MAG: hypothetical protein FJ104_17075, partial [Deltaproteobacteria bacterium]|nr:hypothetical protein [Deltaproteobacteria bacterium]
MSELPAPPLALDPELEALPPPKRPLRLLALGALVGVAVASAALVQELWPLARFGLSAAPPVDLGSGAALRVDPSLEGRWVRLAAPLGDTAAEYRRPLDPDRFRLVRVAGPDDLLVELRVPGDLDPRAYLPPASFVGRLSRLSQAGVRHRALVPEATELLGVRDPDRVWLLVDGETPESARWALALAALLGAFALLGASGALRLLLP